MSRNNLEKEVKKYLQSIKNALPVTHRERTALMKHFTKGVQEYCLENEEFTMIDCIFYILLLRQLNVGEFYLLRQ